MDLELHVHKVPHTTQAEHSGVAWVGTQRSALAGKNATILGHTFVVRVTGGLTANEVALNSDDRTSLRVGVGEAVTVQVK